MNIYIKKCNSITKFIKNKLDKKFDAKTIESYAIKTTVKQRNQEYDIDMALIFHNLNENKVINQKQKIYDSSKLYKKRIKDNPIVKYKEYTITLDFESSNSENKYHFNHTIYNKQNYVVKGKQYAKKKFEESKNIDFVNEELQDDSKEHFYIVIRLLKHYVKNDKFKSSINIILSSINIILLIITIIKLVINF